MKNIIAIAFSMLAITALALVSGGKTQKITVNRDAQQSLTFIVDNGKRFADVDSCAIHCWQRSSSIDQKSEWANLVDVHFITLLSVEDRQYIGDRFVANKVYPDSMTWEESGKTNIVDYRPDEKSFRKQRILK